MGTRRAVDPRKDDHLDSLEDDGVEHGEDWESQEPEGGDEDELEEGHKGSNKYDAGGALATTRGKKAVLLQEQVQKKGRAAFRTAVSASASMEDSSRKKSLGTTETLSVPYLPSEFDGKQGPADYNSDYLWDKALKVSEDKPTSWDNEYCTHTRDGTAENPGYWYVKFKDGERKHVSKIRLWNRFDTGCLQVQCEERLKNACVKFSTDGVEPSNDNTNCDMNLPDNIVGGDNKEGTEASQMLAAVGAVFCSEGAEIGRGTTSYPIGSACTLLVRYWDRGHSLALGVCNPLSTSAPEYILTVCGVELYKTSDRPVTLFDNDLLTAAQSSDYPSAFGPWDSPPTVNGPLLSPPLPSHTAEIDNQHGWWSAEFTDGQPRFVSAVELRNRVDDDGGCCPNRLSFTDVLFDDETEPAFTLPNVAKGGTVVDVRRTITKIKIRNSGIYADGQKYFMTVRGFRLFTPAKKTLSVPYLPSEFETEQGPESVATMEADLALDVSEDAAKYFCTHTAGGTEANPGYWYVNFKDNVPRHVSKIRMWTRGYATDEQACLDVQCGKRVDNACVRFSTDGTIPSKTNPESGCDMNLPDNVVNADNKEGTEVVIDKMITGMMLIKDYDQRIARRALLSGGEDSCNYKILFQHLPEGV
eukprot:g7706.t1